MRVPADSARMLPVYVILRALGVLRVLAEVLRVLQQESIRIRSTSTQSKATRTSLLCWQHPPEILRVAAVPAISNRKVLRVFAAPPSREPRNTGSIPPRQLPEVRVHPTCVTPLANNTDYGINHSIGRTHS